MAGISSYSSFAAVGGISVALITPLWNWITDHATVLSAVVSAIAAAAVACFTISLVRASKEQARLTDETLRLARDEFAATHRPKIRVRAIGLDDKLTNREQMAVRFTCMNIGDAPCEITNVRYRLDPAEKPDAPRRRMNMDIVELDQPRSVPTGDATSFTTKSFTKEAAQELSGEWDFYGFVQYRDRLGVTRTTGFWRRYKVGTATWKTPDNPDYNYEY